MTKQREVGRSRHGKADAVRPSHVRGHYRLHTLHRFLSDTTNSPLPGSSRPARPSRRAKAAQQPRTTSRGKPQHHWKKRSAANLPLQASEVLTVSARQSSQQTSHSQIAQRLLPTTHRKSAAPPITVPAPGQPLAPAPRTGAIAGPCGNANASQRLPVPALHRQQTLSGSRLLRSLPERDCSILPPPRYRPAPSTPVRRSRTPLPHWPSSSLPGSAASG